ncbi:MAG: hypothetical protein PF689_07235 [Deltaproteobacteria bacterium]|jgi:hypothetical protein|nr:hypothetical protein [Deltaproteobacteria bacterium]
MEPIEKLTHLIEFIQNRYKLEVSNLEKYSFTLDFEGEANTYKLKCNWEEEYLNFFITPFATSARSEQCFSSLSKYLIKANSNMEWVYFSIRSDGVPELNSYLPLAGLSEQTIERVLAYLLYYGDKHYFNVLNLANNENAKISDLSID